MMLRKKRMIRILSRKIRTLMAMELWMVQPHIGLRSRKSVSVGVYSWECDGGPMSSCLCRMMAMSTRMRGEMRKARKMAVQKRPEVESEV
jgi:hypothetical protein